MINILIVEDNTDKLKKITDFIRDSIPSLPLNIKISNCINTARYELMETKYDLLILDIQLPEFPDSVVKTDAGITFLQEILHESTRKQRRRTLNRPISILLLSAHKESISSFEEEFSDTMFKIAEYTVNSDGWQIILNQMLEHTISILESAASIATQYIYDIVIICALKKELDFLLQLDFLWERKRHIQDPTLFYFEASLTKLDTTIKIICFSPNQMGISDTSIYTTKLIEYFKPKIILMYGIMGGVKEKVQLGDIVFASISYSHESGKYSEDANGKTTFLPTSTHVNSSPELVSLANELSYDNQIFKEFHEMFIGNKTTNPPNIFIGPLSSGNAVIANESILKGLTLNEKIC